MKGTLQNISNELYKILSSVNNIEDEEELLRADEEIQALNMQFEEKIENFANYIKHLDCQIASVDLEIQRLTKLKNTRKNRARWLKSVLMGNMDMHDRKSIEFDTMKIAIQKSPLSVYIDNETIIPKDWYNKKEVFHLDKTRILEHFKNTKKNIPGCFVVEKSHLRIR